MHVCNNDVCVMVCVITRRFGAHSKGFHRRSLRVHPRVAVPFQHENDEERVTGCIAISLIDPQGVLSAMATSAIAYEWKPSE
jgi:hypothetical protein